MYKNDMMKIPMPGIFDAAEITEAFRNAASFVVNEDLKWQCETRSGDGDVGVNSCLRQYYVYAVPVYLWKPGGLQRGVLGKREKWERRSNRVNVSNSEVTVYLCAHNFEMRFREGDWFHTVHLRVDALHRPREGGTQLISDPDHAGFRPYRGAFDRIRADFLTNLIREAGKNPRTQIERLRDSSFNLHGALVGSDVG